ncbi:MAG: zf-HC2 domain-containing protein [Cytophagales bacterium]|nr:zf-HC2 domain-containing protein [Armatimonadota bacterium]
MICRRVGGLLSAYLDAELTQEETDLVDIHLAECPHCRGEYQSLLDTKRLLSSLANRASRVEIEALIRVESRQEPIGAFRGVLRPRPLAATALLSLRGFWAASVSLDNSSDGTAPGAGSIAASVNATAFSYSGVGARSLRHVVSRIHNDNAALLPGPVDSYGMAIPPGGSYPIAVSTGNWRSSHPVSLHNAYATATNPSQFETPERTTVLSVPPAPGDSGSNYRAPRGESTMQPVFAERERRGFYISIR